MRDKMEPDGKFEITNIRLRDGEGGDLGTAPDRVLDIPRGEGTVRAVYDSLRREGVAFFRASYDVKRVG